MIIGNSMDATKYKIFKRLDDSCEYEKALDVDEINLYENDFNYEFVDYKIENHIPEDSWHQAINYRADSITLLIECDYCGKHFVTTEHVRLRKAGAHRSTLRKGNIDIEYGDDTLFKDNCKTCLYEKIQESTMMIHGVTHFMQSPQNREKWFKKWKKTFNENSAGWIRVSKGQKYLADMFNAELNVPVSGFYADMVFDNKIIIEYDGGGHNLSVLKGDLTQEEFNEKELIREQFLIDKGYKIIRFVSNSEYFPKDENYTKNLISETIANLYLSEQNKAVITMGNKVDDPIHGKLKPIKEILKTSQFGGVTQ